jgi:hypothetical protein
MPSISLFIFGRTGVWTSGLTLVRQVLYLWIIHPAPTHCF